MSLEKALSVVSLLSMSFLALAVKTPWPTGVDVEYSVFFETLAFPGWAMLFLVAASVGPLLTFLGKGLSSALSIDPQGVGRDAFRFAFRRTFGVSSLFALAVGLTLVIGIVWMTLDALRPEMILALAALTLLGWLWLGATRPEVSSGESRSWWWPRWPGLRAIGRAAVLLSGALAIQLILGFGAQLIPWKPLSWVLAPLGLAFSFLIAVLFARVLWAETSLSEVWQLFTRNFGAALSFQAHYLMLTLVVLVPLATLAIWNWVFLPVDVVTLDSLGRRLPQSVQLAVASFNALGRYGWIWYPPLHLLFTALGAGRVAVAIGNQAGEGARDLSAVAHSTSG